MLNVYTVRFVPDRDSSNGQLIDINTLTLKDSNEVHTMLMIQENGGHLH